MDNITRDIPRRLDLECFHSIFHLISAELFVDIKREAIPYHAWYLDPIVEIIEEKIENEISKKHKR